MNRFKRLYYKWKGIHVHTWKKYQVTSEGMVFYCRNCPACKADEVQQNGPIGKDWRNIYGEWRWDWERKRFFVELNKLRGLE